MGRLEHSSNYSVMGLRWQKEDEKKRDGVVTCGKESVSMDDDTFMEYE